VATLKFEELDVSKSTLEKLKNANIEETTPQQQTIISHAVSNKSLIIKSEEGSDRRTGFAVAALEAIQNAENGEGTAGIILTNTPHDSRSISDQLQALGMPQDQCPTIDDEGDTDWQAQMITNEPSIIVANPDRMQALLQEHRFIFRHVQLVILDGLDEMVEGGQADNLKRIKRRVLSNFNALISAREIDSDIKKLASSYTDEPEVVGFESSDSTDEAPPEIPDQLKQGYINVPHRMKISTLMAHLEQTPDGNCVVFTASKRGTDRLYRVLKKRGKKATSLHSKLSDEKLGQRFSNFTNGDVQYLLVADISAAELDVQNVGQVINYDVPNSPDEYRYRAALLSSDSKSRIVSLVSKQDRSDINELQNDLGQTPDEIALPEKVKQKLKERKQNKSSNNKNNNNNGRQKKSRGKRQRNQNNQKRQKRGDGMELPRPSYDKLSGGRAGDHDEKETGIVKFFKKLFS
jgi:superfamily II DNA/RNA helicase